MPHRVKKPWWPLSASLVFAGLTFLLAWYLLSLLAMNILNVFIEDVHPALVPVLFGILWFFAYLLARVMFVALRWRQVEMDEGFCMTCGYNLTGNVSGVCPECGEPVNETRGG